MSIKSTLIFTGIWFFCLPACSEAQYHQPADSLRLKGEKYHEKGRFREAALAYEQAFKLYKQAGDTANWLPTGQYFAEVLAYQGEYEHALDLFYMLKEIQHPANDKSYRARIEHDLAWVFDRQGKYRKALKYYKRGLSLAEEAQDSLMVAYLLLGTGGVYVDLNDDLKALEYRKKVLPYFKALDNRGGLASTLNNIGLAYSRLHMQDKALNYLHQSLEICLQLKNVNRLAAVYTSIAGVLRRMGDYNRALSAYNKSLHYRKQAGNHRYTAVTLNNIGVLYSELGDDEKALQYYRESLALKKNITSPLSLAATYENIGSRLWELDNRTKALAYHKKALSLRKTTGDPQEIARSLIDLAEMKREAGYSKATSEYALQVQTIADSTDNKHLQVASSRLLGLIARDQEQSDKAISHLKQAYAYSLVLPPKHQLTLLKELAHTYNELESDSALVYGKTAIDLIEKQRSRVVAQAGLKTSYFRQHSDFYINMASWMLKYRGDMDKAYRLVEMAKARSLSDDLAQASLQTETQLPDQIRIQKARKLDYINGLYSRMDTVQNQQLVKKLDQKARTAELDYAAFQSKVFRDHSIKQFKTPSPISLAQAQNSMDEETAILEYAVSSEYLVSFFISKQRVVARQFNINELQDMQHLDRQVKALITAIQSQADNEMIFTMGQALYNLLIGPFRHELKTYSNIIVVPDGIMAYLPFEVLSDRGRYLIEHFDIKYAPSVTSLSLIKEPSADPEHELLAVAGSGSEKTFSEAGIKRASPYTALPATLIEVDSVAANFGRATTLKGDQVSERSLKRLMLQRYRFIHLATHGVINERRPGRSGLVVAGTNNERSFLDDDGLLTSYEIYQMNIPSEMIVLSSCKSGLGKVVKGEGILGLQRSFFYAGASTVVVSLWNVYDRSTAYLMDEFYKAILAEEQKSSWLEGLWSWIGWNKPLAFGTKATAMRQAKLKLLNHPTFSHPVYWAPFIVVGR